MKLNEATREVLEENPETESHKVDWLFFVKVLRKLGYFVSMKFEKSMPSPDSIMREWRRQMKKEETKAVKEGKIITQPIQANTYPTSWMIQ